ncbi:MAG: hypothetical protein Q4G69_05245 [Planctomycetia bacterium]|nr:hypothetical protein [Planctomycetia bacterium]
MRRNRKRYLSLCLLGLAFCMLQLHITAGCCFVHHIHSEEISNNAEAAGSFDGTCSHHEDIGSHFCDHSSEREEADSCVIFLLSDPSKQLSQVHQLIISFYVSGFSNMFSAVKTDLCFSSNRLSAYPLDSPLYLRCCSFLI